MRRRWRKSRAGEADAVLPSYLLPPEEREVQFAATLRRAGELVESATQEGPAQGELSKPVRPRGRGHGITTAA